MNTQEVMVSENEKQWFAVYCKPDKEDLVTTNLRQKGIEVFFPQLYLPDEPRKQRKLIPLFPGYLFAHLILSTEFRRVRYTQGVNRLVGTSSSPWAIDGALIKGLKGLAKETEVIEGRLVIKVGETVTIHDGPLAGLSGILLNPPNGRQRVYILMNLLGHYAKISMPTSSLRLRWTYEQPARR